MNEFKDQDVDNDSINGKVMAWVYNADITSRFYDTKLYMSYMTINNQFIGLSG